ncbi:MAG: rhodanese-like domain-containing protein [Myxococcales bacterium]|nr:rhodanese-like domain-containing protein [Myxococcales bacterium]
MLNSILGARRPHAARKLVEQGALLLDVRSVPEYAQGNIPGSYNIPVQELNGRLQELGKRGRHVVVYCRSGARSAHASELLTAAGYRVTDIGPMHAW